MAFAGAVVEEEGETGGTSGGGTSGFDLHRLRYLISCQTQAGWGKGLRWAGCGGESGLIYDECARAAA